MAESTGVVERTERWFVAQGLPHFIAEYSATQDIFTRALPLLTVIFVFEVLGALNLDWVWWANLTAVAGGIGILIAGLVVVNKARGRPALARPDTIGTPEIAAFVLAPALLPAVFGGQVAFAASTAAGNLALLGIIYVGTSYAVLPLLKWAIRRLLRQIGGVFDLLVRTLPLLLLFVTLLFITSEVWQVGANLVGGALWGVIALFVAAGTVFLASRVPREIGRLSTFESEQQVRELATGTPVEDSVPDRIELRAPRLSRRQWVNVALVALFTQGIQVLLVSMLIGTFTVGFGLLALDPEIIQSWTGAPPNVLASFWLGDKEMILTEELLRVATLLSAFSGLYFTVAAITDATYREEFYEDIVGELRRSFAARQVYLTLRESRPEPGDA